MCLFEPNDTHFVSGDQWNLAVVDATKAWDISEGSSTIKIGIVDTGAKQDHEDLINKIGGGDHLGDSSNEIVNGILTGHGTFVSGLAGGETNNGKGIANLGNKVSIYTYGGDINNDNHLANQIEIASQACDIVNLSWVIVEIIKFGDWHQTCPDCLGAAYNKWSNYVYDDFIRIPSTNAGIQQAISNAINEHGTIFVASGGNDSHNPDLPDKEHCDPWQIPFINNPSAYPNVIAVSATELTNPLPNGAEQFKQARIWPAIYFAAPGVSVWSTTKSGSYTFWGGTSFSSPQVAALIGLMKSVNPSLTIAQVYRFLRYLLIR